VSEYTDNVVPDERLKAKDREVQFCVLTYRTDCITWCLESVSLYHATNVWFCSSLTPPVQPPHH